MNPKSLILQPGSAFSPLVAPVDMSIRVIESAYSVRLSSDPAPTFPLDMKAPILLLADEAVSSKAMSEAITFAVFLATFTEYILPSRYR